MSLSHRVAIIGYCVVWICCLTSPVFSIRGVGSGDVGKAAVGNAVLASGTSVRLLSQSPVRFGFGVGGCCLCAAAAAQLPVVDAVTDLE